MSNFLLLFLSCIVLNFDVSLLNLNFATDGLAEVSAVHADVLGVLLVNKVGLAQDSSFKGDSFGSVDVVTSDHTDIDSSSVALNNSVSDSFSKWVLKSKDTNHGELSLNCLHIVSSLKIVVLLLHGVELIHGVVNIGDQERAQAFVGVLLNNRVDAVIFLIFIELNGFTVGSDHVLAGLDNHLGGTLAVNTNGGAVIDQIGGSGPLTSRAERNGEAGCLGLSLFNLTLGIGAGVNQVVDQTDFSDVTSCDVTPNDVASVVFFGLNESGTVHDD